MTVRTLHNLVNDITLEATALKTTAFCKYFRQDIDVIQAKKNYFQILNEREQGCFWKCEYRCIQ